MPQAKKLGQPGNMNRLNPEKLHVTYLNGISREKLILPRRYTLTHSDSTGELFLSIGYDFDRNKISSLYTRLMRDEILAEIVNNEEAFLLRVYCHVSGGFIIGTAGWRYNIFQNELPLVWETIRYGDRAFFNENLKVDNAIVEIHFQSNHKRFSKVENWGLVSKYN
jgi:hypothetical protein